VCTPSAGESGGCTHSYEVLTINVPSLLKDTEVTGSLWQGVSTYTFSSIEKSHSPHAFVKTPGNDEVGPGTGVNAIGVVQVSLERLPYRFASLNVPEPQGSVITCTDDDALVVGPRDV